MAASQAQPPDAPGALGLSPARWIPVATFLAAMGYAVMKVVLAARGELGLPGFPAPPRPGIVPWSAQLGNAALGVVGAVLALAAARRWSRWPEVALAVAVGAAAVLEISGAAVLVARVLRVTSGFGDLPPGGGPWLGAGYAVVTSGLFTATAVLLVRRVRAPAPLGRRDAPPPAR